MKVENNRDNSTNLRNRTPKPFKVNAIHKVKTDKKNKRDNRGYKYQD